LLVDVSRRAEVGIRISLPASPPKPRFRPRPVEPDEPAAVYQVGTTTLALAERPVRPYGDGWAVPAGTERATDALRSLEYVVVDVETTGGSFRGGDRVTEVAAVRLDGAGRPIAEFTTLVNPERPIPPFIAALTNITREMVSSAPRFGEIAARLRAFLAGAVFVAHNASFDWRFLCDELASTDGRPLRGRVLCTVRLARRVVPEISHRSLDALQWFFGIENEARHRAYGDARATARIFRRLLDRIDEREIVCWDDIERLLARRPPVRRARRAMPTSVTDI
jgi:DNA polymerase-3 subunit epsilon